MKKKNVFKKQFQTTHNLAFEYAPWERSDDWFRFRIGTCHGLWRSTSFSCDILVVDNDEPGNGHLEDTFEWFENSCRRDGKLLRIMEIFNSRFKKHLMEKRGFTEIGIHCIKQFK